MREQAMAYCGLEVCHNRSAQHELRNFYIKTIAYKQHAQPVLRAPLH
jgi:hypothetical protein